ncbi:MerR family transcriptional regulator, partial [Pseudomonas sp. BGM005]|nr:MerR family transcriptional regulator [Pseudomonas sp. BG5]
FDASNQWWHEKSLRAQREWKQRTEALVARWRELLEAGHDPDAPTAREHAAVPLRWFAEIPGTPMHAGDAENSRAMVLGMADMYESDPAFHVT